MVLRQRVVEPEWMDDPALDAAEHARALRGLARINRLSRSAGVFWPAMRGEAARLRSDRPPDVGRPLRVVDFACGGGDVLINLARRALRAGVRVDWTGLDISDVALQHAAAAAREAGVTIGFLRHDLIRQPIVARYDVAISSLFLHHLDTPAAQRVLARMREAAPCVLVNDLRRGWVPYGVAWAGVRLLSRSPVVHVDGPQSVAAGWTWRELRDLAEAAGLHGAAVASRFPGRLSLVWCEGVGDE